MSDTGASETLIVTGLQLQGYVVVVVWLDLFRACRRIKDDYARGKVTAHAALFYGYADA